MKYFLMMIGGIAINVGIMGMLVGKVENRVS